MSSQSLSGFYCSLLKNLQVCNQDQFHIKAQTEQNPYVYMYIEGKYIFKRIILFLKHSGHPWRVKYVEIIIISPLLLMC